MKKYLDIRQEVLVAQTRYWYLNAFRSKFKTATPIILGGWVEDQHFTRYTSTASFHTHDLKSGFNVHTTTSGMLCDYKARNRSMQRT